MQQKTTFDKNNMILILKTGSTLDNIKALHGDFEDWIAEKMHMHPTEYQVHPTGDYNRLPPKKDYSGIIITGSPDMVTEINLKNTRIHGWLMERQKSGTPMLGICFGHQLLNILNGGTVAFNPGGNNTGMEKTHLTHAGRKDKLLGDLPDSFEVYKVHQQSILTPPEFAKSWPATMTGSSMPSGLASAHGAFSSTPNSMPPSPG